MIVTGGCHCGRIRCEAAGKSLYGALCHCGDCRRCAGAPMVGWAIYPQTKIKITQCQPKTYASSKDGRSQFCADCGAGLFYVNDANIPGFIEIQTATLDDPDTTPPQAQIQLAERIGWMAQAHELPTFDRFPPEG